MQVMFEDNGIARSEYKFQSEDLNKMYSRKPCLYDTTFYNIKLYFLCEKKMNNYPFFPNKTLNNHLLFLNKLTQH